jgi:hypothetical protein
MKPAFLRTLVILQFSLAPGGSLLFAQADLTVMCHTNTTLLQQGGDWRSLTDDLEMPRGIKVFTNGTFQINEGKVRTLAEGQMLRADGFLVNPDGSTMPVFDHISMHGVVTVFRDGEGGALQGDLTLPDGSNIQPDGAYTRPNGRRSRLVDGQLLTLDGTPIAGLDTINLNKGRVMVFKAGALIAVEPANKIMGMYDGTRVSGEGVVMERDGGQRQLTEGQIIPVAGVRADW